MRRLYLLFITVVALSTAPARAAVPDHRSIDQTPSDANFTILPANQQQGQPVKRVFSFSLAPGAVLNDAVLVVNPSKTRPLTVKLNVTDAVTPPQNGGLAFNDTQHQHALGLWIQLAVSSVTVPPYSMTRVPITLHVPASVQPGEYEGSINATDTQPMTVQSGKYKVGVYLDRRCLVDLRVVGVAPIGLAIPQVGMTRLHGASALRFVLQNTGTVIDYPTAVVLTFAGPYKVYTVRYRVGQIVGGASTTVALAVNRSVPPGIYRATIRVTYAAVPAPGSTAQSLQATWSGNLTVK